MKVNFSKDGVNFQKNALLNCTVKRKGTNEKTSATLYLYKEQNPKDIEEIANSNLPIRIKSNFLNLNCANNSRFYALKTDNSGEFVSFAQVSKHFIQDEGKYRGTISTIEEFNTNKEFIDPELPLLSQITTQRAYYLSKYLNFKISLQYEVGLNKTNFCSAKRATEGAKSGTTF